MLSKNEVKYIQSLCHKKQRDEHQLFIAEGPKTVDELLKSDYEIKHVYALKEWIESNSGFTVPLTEVSSVELEKISNLQTPNKVLLIAKQRQLVNEPQFNKLIIVLDGIQDPGNMGTIIRIADWFGIDQIVASEDTVDLYNPKVLQATMGSVVRVSLWYKLLKDFMKGVNVPVYGAVLNGQSVYEASKLKEGIIVIGGEGKGIRQDISDLISHAVTIPKLGGAESLNAAVATGIILSHVVGGKTG